MSLDKKKLAYTGQESVTITLTRNEWGQIMSALLVSEANYRKDYAMGAAKDDYALRDRIRQELAQRR